MVLKQDASAYSHSLMDAWHISADSSICHDVQKGLEQEWLVTNGLGGYAAGSLVGATTRSYHGLLVAALHPPVDRVVMVAKIDEEVLLPGGKRLFLGVNEYQGGTIKPQGNVYLTRVSLDGDIPCFFYQLNETLTLEKRIWMEYGQNTTYVQYRLHSSLESRQQSPTVSSTVPQPSTAPAAAVTLTLSPQCLSRDHHSVTHGSEDWHFLVEEGANRCRVRANADKDTPAYHLIADPSTLFVKGGFWQYHIWHRADHQRGLLSEEDCYQPGQFRMTLQPEECKTLVLAAETETTCSWGYGGASHEELVAHALMRHQRRVRQILAVADRSTDALQESDPVLARLVMAADQFIVARPDYVSEAETYQPLHLSPNRKTILAGYPWFTDWGRDSMIALPGLMLYTGRYSEARGLLKAYISYMQHGLIPNRFPDNGQEMIYNTVDATLWMFRALDHYVLKTGDWSLVKDLFSELREIIQWHIQGTDFGIGVDPSDGLLRSGTPGAQVTWMDAKIDDWVVTPRTGKAVEVNALWYYALSVMENWAVRLSTDAALYGQLRSLVRENFAARFWYEEGGYLYDVVDVDGVSHKNDASLRPNQLFAASLMHDLIPDRYAASVLQKVTADLLTPAGIRTLSPHDANYHPRFAGTPFQRDSAYHQGTVWQWLMGAYVDVFLRVHNKPAAVLPLLEPLLQQLWSSCLGSLSEVAEPEPPYTPAGCPAQAWSVSELLRSWYMIRASLL